MKMNWYLPPFDRTEAEEKLTLKLEDLDLAEPEVLLLLSVVADVDELPRVAVSVVAEEDRLLLLELALELGARLVHRLVALQEFCKGQENVYRVGE